jgi:hypothetical protein
VLGFAQLENEISPGMANIACSMEMFILGTRGGEAEDHRGKRVITKDRTSCQLQWTFYGHRFGSGHHLIT